MRVLRALLYRGISEFVKNCNVRTVIDCKLRFSAGALIFRLEFP